MRRPLLLALVALAAGAGNIQIASARDDYDDRRHDRRQAVVAGAVRHEIAEDRAEAHYRDCMRGGSYDRECDRQRYYEEQEARRKGRRTAVAVGVLN
jgi:hypothetical protein